MKKILVITTSYFPFTGGGEVGVKRLVQAIKTHHGDYQLSILTPRYHPSHPAFEIDNGVEVFRYNSCLIKYPSKLFPNVINLLVHMMYGLMFIGRHIKRINPDFAIINFLLPSAFPATYHLRKRRIPNLVFLAGNDIHNKNWIIRRTNEYVFKNTRRIIIASEFVRRTIQDEYGMRGLNLEMIPYGIDSEDYSYVNKTAGAQINILCVQRLVKIKGTEYLILALSKLVSEGISNFTVDIVGDGEEKSRLEELVASLNLQGRITFHGNVENNKIKSFYQHSNVFVFPTLTEPFGIVLLEAMATNNIIIASRCGAIPEIIQDEQNGILFQPGDVTDLSNKLRSVLNNIDDFTQLGENARHDVSRYELSTISKRILDLLSTVA